MFNIDDANADVGMYNFDAQRLARVTYTSEFEGIPVWTPDGSRISFAAEKGPGLQIFWKDWSDPRGMPGATAGPKAPDEPIAPGEFPRVPYAFSPDGRFLAFTEVHPETRRDIWIAQMGAGAKAPYPFVVTPFQDTQPSFSPNGDWIIYESNESGDAIYARPFPGPGERIQLTPNGSSSGRWARNGELFYWMFGRMFAVTVTPKGGALDVGTPVPLFEVKDRPAYDVTPDGQRLLMTIPEPRTNYDLVLVQGWAPARSRSAAQ